MTQKHRYAEKMQISASHNHLLSFISLCTLPPTFRLSLIQSHHQTCTLCPSFSTCLPLSVSFLCFILLHTLACKYIHTHTHMHISLCPDTSTPLYLPFRLGATRLIHLHSCRGERGIRRGTNKKRKRRGRRLGKSQVPIAVIWQRCYSILHLDSDIQTLQSKTLRCHCTSYSLQMCFI